MGFQITSPHFTRDGPIPRRFTCDGENVSPALSWTDPPDGTAAFALIVDDPDAPDPAAPRRTWVHWVLYDLPATLRGLPEAVGHSAALPDGARVGLNDWGRAEYGGPCPPIGRHRYFFRLYALERPLGDLGRATRADVDRAMKEHILAEATLMGTYQKAAGGSP